MDENNEVSNTIQNVLPASSEEVLWKLTEEKHFSKLRDAFKFNSLLLKSKCNVEENENEEKPQEEEVPIDKEQFLKIVDNILESNGMYDSLIIELFDQIDCQDVRQITWDNFLDFNLKALQPKTTTILQFGEVKYEQPTQIKRDSIIKIVLLETDLYFSYAMITKYGKVSLYNGAFDYLRSYMAIMSSEDQFRSEKEARKRYRWITDAVFMPDVHMFVVVNSTRSMTIYDASGLKHVALWHVSGFPNIIQSIAYAPNGIATDNKTEHEDSWKCKKTLVLGSNHGDIALMTFLKQKDTLLKKKFQDKMSIYYYLDLENHKDYVTIKSLGKIHSDAIISLQLLDDNSIVSCSRDSTVSLVVKQLEKIVYSLSVRRGINCFAICTRHKILVTGSDDGFVRLWSYHKPIVGSTSDKPLEVIRVSKTGIVDVVIMEQLQVFFTCSRNAEMKFYDLKEHTCLQVIRLQFECFGTVGRSIEWSAKCINPGPKRERMQQLWERNCLLITCCNIYAKIDLYYMDGIERHLHGDLLPAQPLQNSVLIPKDWEHHETPSDPHHNPVSTNTNATMEQLDFILRKDLVHDLKLKEKSYIHSKIAFLEDRKAKMKWAVEQCAPFLALGLYDINEVDLPLDLPIVENKRTKSVVDRTRLLLKDATARSVIFSDISSSSKSSTRTRSSRSSTSTYEFE